VSKKSKSTSTMTPIVPDWITSPVQGVMGRIDQLGRMDPYGLVAGSNPLLDRGVALAGQLGAGEFQTPLWDRAREGLESPVFDDILGGGAPTATAASGLDGLDAWFNRYTDDVIAATLGRFDEDARAAATADTLRLGGAFGGSGAALAAAARERERTLNRSQLEAGLRHQGWESAAGHSSQDADRRTNVSIANAQLEAQNRALQLQAAQARAGGWASLAAGYGQDLRETVGLLGDFGGYLRGLEQERLSAPLTLAGAQAGLLGQLPLSLWQGQRTTSTTKESDPLGALGQLAQIASGIPFGSLFGGASRIPQLSQFTLGALGGQPLYDGGAYLSALSPYVR
jgi:hypothetical protein